MAPFTYMYISSMFFGFNCDGFTMFYLILMIKVFSTFKYGRSAPRFSSQIETILYFSFVYKGVAFFVFKEI
jgi:hypothetical protein